MTRRHIAVYISGHGYGHLAQIAPVLNRLHGLCGDLRFVLRTELPESLVARRVRAPFTHLAGPVDVGVVQHSAISEDIPATLVAARAFYAAFDKRVGDEAERLSPHRPVAILSDISPLAFPVAKRLDIPGIAVASLDWHDIYRHFLPADDPLLALLAGAHAACDLLIQPQLCMPMRSFAHRTRVAITVDDAWTGIARPECARKTALIMFGGAGDPPFDIQALGLMPEWRFLVLNPVPAHAPANVRQANVSHGTAALMQACDIVITKPGYGTLAECWQTGTPLAYVPRELFPEYPYLDDWLQSSAPAARMDLHDFVSGNWLPAMRQALASTQRYPRIPASGAHQAAALIARALPSAT